MHWDGVSTLGPHYHLQPPTLSCVVLQAPGTLQAAFPGGPWHCRLEAVLHPWALHWTVWPSLPSIGGVTPGSSEHYLGDSFVLLPPKSFANLESIIFRIEWVNYNFVLLNEKTSMCLKWINWNSLESRYFFFGNLHLSVVNSYFGCKYELNIS